MAEFYEGSFGDLRLWISKISTDKSRTQVIHEPSIGDDHVVQDRGRVPLISKVTLLFDRMIGDDLEPIDRLRAFSALVDDKSRQFRHPIEGSFTARIRDFNYDIDGDGVISGSVDVVAVSDVEPVTPAGPGGIPASGEGAVQQAAADVDNELMEIGMSSPVPSAAAATVDAWAASDDPNPRQILADLGSITEQLGDLSSKLSPSLDMWEAYKNVVILADAVRSAAAVAMVETSNTFTVRIGSPIALRSLVASIYGADEADLRYSQAIKLNDIPNPAWLEPGTELQLPTPASKPRNG